MWILLRKRRRFLSGEHDFPALGSQPYGMGEGGSPAPYLGTTSFPTCEPYIFLFRNVVHGHVQHSRELKILPLSNHLINTRLNAKLTFPSLKLRLMKMANSFVNQSIVLWKSLPSEEQNIAPSDSFKKAL